MPDSLSTDERKAALRHEVRDVLLAVLSDMGLLGNGVEAGYGRAFLKARGVAVYVMLGVALILATNVYAGFRVERAVERISIEHKAMLTSLNIQACINSYSFEERVSLREALKRSRTSQEAFSVLTAWCPWMELR